MPVPIAVTDRLTGLYNRNRIDDNISAELRRANRSAPRFSIILLDLDHFKAVNDPYGHLQGDAGLQQLAKLIRAHIRETALAGRWGGAEFIAVLPETELANTLRVVEALRECVTHSSFIPVGAVIISVGLAANLPDDGLETLFARVDAVLSTAKRNGRNRVEPL